MEDLKVLERELEFQKQLLFIDKASWLEHFKAEKDISEMYGGIHWRAVKVRESKEEVRQVLEQQHNKIVKIEKEIKRIKNET